MIIPPKMIPKMAAIERDERPRVAVEAAAERVAATVTVEIAEGVIAEAAEEAEAVNEVGQVWISDITRGLIVMSLGRILDW